jgi:hypothetical protein
MEDIAKLGFKSSGSKAMLGGVVGFPVMPVSLLIFGIGGHKNCEPLIE